MGGGLQGLPVRGTLLQGGTAGLGGFTRRGRKASGEPGDGVVPWVGRDCFGQVRGDEICRGRFQGGTGADSEVCGGEGKGCWQW